MATKCTDPFGRALRHPMKTQQRILARPTTLHNLRPPGPGYRWIAGTSAYGRVTRLDRLHDAYVNLRHPLKAWRCRQTAGFWLRAW